LIRTLLDHPFFTDFLYSFIPIFVAMDIGGLIPIYIGLTRSLSAADRRRVNMEALATAFIISVTFVLVGRSIFAMLGISAEDFMIAGGVLLLILAIMEMVKGEAREAAGGGKSGVVPLGTPLIIGPAVLTSLLILIPLHGYAATLLALAANLLLLAIAFKFAHRMVEVIGEKGLRAVSQVISLFLAAIAVSMIRRGIQGLR
jgi:multiple antibiotic resistance protein